MSLSFILPRILIAYNAILVCFVPKKLRAFLLPSWLCPNYYTNAEPPIAAVVGLPEKMDAAELRRVFGLLDQNGDGRITLQELSDSLEKMGIFIADVELRQMIDRIDADGDGCVDAGEFEALYKSIMDGGDGGGDGDDDRDMLEAFNVFDQNGDGFITVDELQAVLGSLGLAGGAETDCRMMIKKVDSDGDGMVSFSEFKQMMRSGGGGASFTAALAS
ncbi:calmodulin-like protein 7 [Andrographis paniculata]|uniref:calmodulin-like protein 7 n=1 Tax=Andrographis paniculata TaxID=175694 RepID=UPI0021E93A30|nr:calmodulin-like protein 7 [Andrographis paniculata]